jgi:hypothetical protein
MKKFIPITLALFGLMAPLLAGQSAQAAAPAPITEEQNMRTGTIDLLKLDKGLVVIDDSQYRVSDRTIVNGRNSASLRSLRNGMKIRFAYQPGPVYPEITEILITQ